MGVQFTHIRKLALANVPDADPNLSAPDPVSVFTLRDRPPYGKQTSATAGNTIFLDFRDTADAMVYGPTADLTVWFLDETSGVWARAEALLKCAHLEAFLTWHIFSALCFAQITQVTTPGTAATVTIRMMEI